MNDVTPATGAADNDTSDTQDATVADRARPRVAVVFGGRSSEHAISCVTAGSVLAAIDRAKYDVLPLGITQDGRWALVADAVDRLAISATGKLPDVTDVAEAGGSVVLAADPTQRDLAVIDTGEVTGILGGVDVVFPLLHGAYGEDGTLQGLLELAGVPYVGSGVLASSVSMDKEYMKRVFEGFGLPIGPYVTVRPRDWERDPAAVRRSVAALGFPVFVKPARAGSSLGISKVHGPETLDEAIEAARKHDPKVIVDTPDSCSAALAAESAALTRGIERADVRAIPAPVGEWLLDEGAVVPAGYAAVRARFSRLRGELREAAAWAREGLRGPGDRPACRRELALAAAQSADATTAYQVLGGRPHGGGAATWQAAVAGDIDGAVEAITDDVYDAVRLGVPEPDRGRLTGVFRAHADALARGDGPALDRAAEALEERGFLLFAAEAHAQAVRAHRDPRAARTSRTRAVALARRCQGARTPALSGLVLGELTARQRQIVTLAAAGLSNRQIAEKLTLSIRTVGNHLYSAYARLGASDRGALPWLVELPQAQPA
jgi:D-alanine--D-alanine ligase